MEVSLRKKAKYRTIDVVTINDDTLHLWLKVGRAENVF